MTEKELKALKFFDEPRSLLPSEYNSFVVPCNSNTRFMMFKKRSDKLMRNIRQYPAPISKAKVGA
jgi:hypothetical protein